MIATRKPTPRPPLPARTCEHCGEDFTPAREAAFCSSDCRQSAWQERARTARVASVRRLKGGAMSVVLHMHNDIELAPGQTVRVGETPCQIVSQKPLV